MKPALHTLTSHLSYAPTLTEFMLISILYILQTSFFLGEILKLPFAVQHQIVFLLLQARYFPFCFLNIRILTQALHSQQFVDVTHFSEIVQSLFLLQQPFSSLLTEFVCLSPGQPLKIFFFVLTALDLSPIFKMSNSYGSSSCPK